MSNRTAYVVVVVPSELEDQIRQVRRLGRVIGETTIFLAKHPAKRISLRIPPNGTSEGALVDEILRQCPDHRDFVISLGKPLDAILLPSRR